VKRYGLHSFLFTGLLLLAATVSSRVRAEQFVLLDLTYEATAQNTTDSHFPAKPAANIPQNLKTPVDYASGTAYVRFEVLTKPSAAKTLYNICFENASNYACLPYPPAYTATGVYNYNAPFSAFWQGNLVDWTMGISGVQLIIKDEKETKVQGDAMFYPYKTHVTITLVAPGSTYVPPTAGAAGAPGAAGSPAAGASAAGRGGSGAAGKAGSGGAGASATAGASAGSSSSAGSGAVEDGDAAGGGGSSPMNPVNQAGSRAAMPDAGSDNAPGDTGEAASGRGGTTARLPAQGVETEPNKRAPPPGNIEAGCSTVTPRGDRRGSRELAGLSCIIALLAARRRRQSQALQRSV
jgi:hypothetical protein